MYLIWSWNSCSESLIFSTSFILVLKWASPYKVRGRISVPIPGNHHKDPVCYLYKYIDDLYCKAVWSVLEPQILFHFHLGVASTQFDYFRITFGRKKKKKKRAVI